MTRISILPKLCKQIDINALFHAAQLSPSTLKSPLKYNKGGFSYKFHAHLCLNLYTLVAFTGNKNCRKTNNDECTFYSHTSLTLRLIYKPQTTSSAYSSWVSKSMSCASLTINLYVNCKRTGVRGAVEQATYNMMLLNICKTAKDLKLFRPPTHTHTHCDKLQYLSACTRDLVHLYTKYFQVC